MIVLRNKTVTLVLEFNSWEKGLSFLKRYQIAWRSPVQLPAPSESDHKTFIWYLYLTGWVCYKERRFSNKLSPGVTRGMKVLSRSQWVDNREQGMAQWWEHSPPTNVAQIQSRRRRHMWFEFVVGYLLWSESFPPGYSGFSSHLKSKHFQIPIRSGRCRHV